MPEVQQPFHLLSAAPPLPILWCVSPISRTVSLSVLSGWCWCICTGLIYCQDCSSRRVGPHRICDACVSDSFHTASDRPYGDTSDSRTARAAPRPSIQPRPHAEVFIPTPNLAGEDASQLSDDGDGDTGVVLGQPSAARIAKLEQRVAELQSQLLTVTRTEMPTPFDMLAHSELAVGCLYPLLAVLAAIGWRLVPASLALYSFTLWWQGHALLLWLPPALCVAWMCFVARSPRMELFRRRMRVYGIAFSSFCDYKVSLCHANPLQCVSFLVCRSRSCKLRTWTRTSERSCSIAHMRGLPPARIKASCSCAACG